MHGDSDRAAGLESADTSGDDNHPERAGGDTVLGHVQAAHAALEGSNKQEAQEARARLCEALTLLQAGALGQG